MYPSLIDFEWFALDSSGYLARFTTAGTGAIPLLALQQEERLMSLYDIFVQLPAQPEARVFAPIEEPSNDLTWAARGFFVYDWNDRHMHGLPESFYERTALPVRPTHAGDLTSEAIRLLTAVPTLSIRFAETKDFSPGPPIAWSWPTDETNSGS